MSENNNLPKLIVYSDNPYLAASIERYLNSIDNNTTTIKVTSLAKKNNNTSLNSIQEIAKGNVEVNDEFNNHLATFFPKFLIDNKQNDSEVDSQSYQYHPSIFDVNNLNIEEKLKKIVSIKNLYYQFYEQVKEIFDPDKIVWNDFELKSKNNEVQDKVFLFNIQSGTKTIWDNLLKKFFELEDIRNCYFIFYYYNDFCRDVDKPEVINLDNSRIIKDAFENEDRLFGYSRFLRDFLKEKKLGSEINLSKKSEELKDELKSLKFQVILYNNQNKNELLINPKEHFTTVFDKINSTLKEIYLSGKKKDEQKNEEDIFNSLFKNDNKYSVLSGLYIYNKNKYAEDKSELAKRFVGDIKIIGSDSHRLLRDIEDKLSKLSIKNEKYFSEVGASQFWNHLRKTISALLRAFISYKDYNNGDAPSFLFIDDNPKLLQTKFKILQKWFEQSKIFYTNNFKWKDYLFNSDKELYASALEKVEQLGANESQEEASDTNPEVKPNFIVIDLDYDGQLVGMDLLRRLRSEIKQIKEKVVYLIVLSRFEDPYIIRTAINNGALLYITKGNFLELIYKVFNLNLKYSENQRKYHTYENWHLLSKLEPAKIARLKANKIFGKDYNLKSSHKYSIEYQWINKLPKADLHCHIGSCMGPDLLPQTAALVLMKKYYSDNGLDEKGKEKLKLIIEYLFPIVTDPYLNEMSENKNLSMFEKTETLKDELSAVLYDKDNKNDDYNTKSILQILTLYLEANDYKKTTEEVLLSPYDSTLERIVASNKKELQLPLFLQEKVKLKIAKIHYAEVMLSFILLLYLREKIALTSQLTSESFVNEKCDFFKSDLIDTDIKKSAKAFLLEFYQTFIEKLPANELSKVNLEKENNIIGFFQSARSKQRCIDDKRGSLFNYLRGCEYAGAEHLQTKEAIYLTTQYIINEYATENNIRYLALRCAVDGYSKMKLQTQEEAMEALLKGFDTFTKDKKIKVNIILTAKRHKTEEEFENNVQLALKYRYGLALNRNTYDKIIKEKKDYYDYPTRVVSFDLAGIEKGNRPSKFEKQFEPLLRDCFPITIHAGEEDDYESIWEAIYKVHSQRIGHGLTLRENEELLESVRERHITIELCPISNYLTRNSDGKYSRYLEWDDDKSWKQLKVSENDKSKHPRAYPLRQYLDENLDVTINTDNPFVNSANLTEEYLFAAQMIGGLTRWEILRLIKNSFRGAAIPKEEKRKLMDKIDDEIFEILLNDEMS